MPYGSQFTAQAFQRGRDRIKEINRQNAESEIYFLTKWSMDNKTAEALNGPMPLEVANQLADEKNTKEGYPLDIRPYRAAVEHVIAKFDPEGVKRLKEAKS